MLYSCVVVSKDSERLQVPDAIQASIAMSNRDTLHSSQLMLPHAGISSRRDLMQALASHANSKASLFAVFKLSQFTTNAASNTLTHNIIHTPSTSTTSSTAPNEDGASEHVLQQSIEKPSRRLQLTSPPKRRRSKHDHAHQPPSHLFNIGLATPYCRLIAALATTLNLLKFKNSPLSPRKSGQLQQIAYLRLSRLVVAGQGGFALREGRESLHVHTRQLAFARLTRLSPAQNSCGERNLAVLQRPRQGG
ncbi:hypothetical protein Q7P35_005926 [Cladosporium inversicolor]